MSLKDMFFCLNYGTCDDICVIMRWDFAGCEPNEEHEKQNKGDEK